MQGTMPPRPIAQPAKAKSLKGGDFTLKQLIALCELRGIGRLSKTQKKAYYVNRLKLAGNDDPPTEDELTALGIDLED